MACNELRLPDGSIKGKCLMEEKNVIRLANITVPLVDARTDERKVIGEVEIDADGNFNATITDEGVRRELEPPPFSFSLPPGAVPANIQDDVEMTNGVFRVWGATSKHQPGSGE